MIPSILATWICAGALMGAGGYRLIVLSGGIQLATIVAAYVFGFFWKKAAS